MSLYQSATSTWSAVGSGGLTNTGAGAEAASWYAWNSARVPATGIVTSSPALMSRSRAAAASTSLTYHRISHGPEPGLRCSMRTYWMAGLGVGVGAGIGA